MLHRNQNS